MIQRIIELRELEGLSQEKFANRLGLSRNFINQAENGKKNFSDRTISDICNKFGVNEQWIRNGTPPMKKLPVDKLSDYLAQIAKGNDEFIQDIIEVYMELDSTSKEALKKIANRFVEKQRGRE